MDTLLAGTLTLLWRVHCAAVMSSVPCCLSKSFPAHRENHSGLLRNRSPSTRKYFHLQPGILFIFGPERFSRSPRNPLHLAPESAPEYAESCRPSAARPQEPTSVLYRY